eukprot:8074913-Pyramimonas_sp.AAC.1
MSPSCTVHSTGGGFRKNLGYRLFASVGSSGYGSTGIHGTSLGGSWGTTSNAPASCTVHTGEHIATHQQSLFPITYRGNQGGAQGERLLVGCCASLPKDELQHAPRMDRKH